VHINLDIHTISQLTQIIEETHYYFAHHVKKQVNVALTLRNWLIGFYIIEYEQNGTDRAEYGKALISSLSANLRQRKLKGFSEIALRLNRTFYLAYPQIQQTLSVEFPSLEKQFAIIQQTPSVELKSESEKVNSFEGLDAALLINNLSFSHFIELLKTDNPLGRAFYEIESIKNSWTVRELQRAMNSMLFERTGLKDKLETLPANYNKKEKPGATDLFRNPLILEFLGLEEKSEYSESDLEQAIIDHLQKFLLEIGRGFCFEARQKRITFDNTHYRIDLVFYHRILKCHVLLDLKIGEFTHADSGQMNVYLNYYKDNEMNPGDQPPIGIILCASHNENLVKYATSGLSQQVFVSKYMINLPREDELKRIIKDEQDKLKQSLLRKHK
jgi:predicted nuclease of restriction endonuclease-like (RecB) superfamily